jgi:hypothetical protein
MPPLGIGVPAMIGHIFITSTGYDPDKGKHVKDPYLGTVPSLGACRPDIRRRAVPGDYIFLISGKVPGVLQYVVGGFEVDQKIDAMTAFRRFPEQRLRLRHDGELAGNVIVNGRGRQHRLDSHSGFERRIENYIVGKNPVALITPEEIARGRQQTLDVLRAVLRKPGATPIAVVGRWGSRLAEDQALELRHWLDSLKQSR